MIVPSFIVFAHCDTCMLFMAKIIIFIKANYFTGMNLDVSF